jgi:hypothetical protein
MAATNLSESLRSVLDYARRALGTPVSGSPIDEHKPTPSAPRPVRHVGPSGEAILAEHRLRKFRDGAVEVIAQAPPAADGHRYKPNVAGGVGAHVASLEIRSGSHAEPQFARLSVAALAALRRFLPSPAGGELLDWLAAVAESDLPEAGEAGGSHLPARSDAFDHIVFMGQGELWAWAKQRKNDADALEGACAAFDKNRWRWEGVGVRNWDRESFFQKLRRRVEKLRAEQQQAAHLQQVQEYQLAYDEYRTLQRHIQSSWDELSGLQDAVKVLRRNLPQWSALFPVEWRGGDEIDRVDARIAELIHAQRPAPRSQQLPRVKATNNRGRQGSPQGVPEWPPEAKAPAAIALAGDQFSYSHGVLSYMGYRVGKSSALDRNRRRRILDYVFCGLLPQVNDRQYMRTWGKPKTATRLRKLANAISAFARNARRKRKKSFALAIAEWEEDLCYLKERYYDRRVRDWKWPGTMKHGNKS